MAKNKGVPVPVNAKVKLAGAAAFKSSMNAMTQGGLMAILTLATGGSKVKAAWEAIKWGTLAKLGVSGMAMMSTAALGLVSALKTMIKTTANLEYGLERVRDIQMRTTQFEPLLKGAQLAKERLESLVKFAASTPFQLPEIAEASRMLEIMGKGALSSAGTLRMVGDAAAVSGRSMDEVAFWVGRFYDGLQAGRPVGEAATRLQEMGLISGGVRQKIEDMSEAGGDMAAAWNVVKKELDQSAGAMVKLSQTIGGLETTLSDTRDLFSQKFADPFAEMKLDELNDEIKILGNMTPIIEDLGKLVAEADKFTLARGTRELKVWITGLAGFSDAVALGARFLKALTVGLVAVTTILIAVPLGRFALGLMGVSVNAKVAAAGTNWFTTAVRAMIPATARGSASLGVLSKAFAMVGVGAQKAGGMIAKLFLPLLLSPWTWILVTLAAVVALFDKWKSSAAALRQVQEDTAKGTSELVNELNKQIKAINTLDEKVKAYQATMNQVTSTQTQMAEETAKLNRLMEKQGRHAAVWQKVFDGLPRGPGSGAAEGAGEDFVDFLGGMGFAGGDEIAQTEARLAGLKKRAEELDELGRRTREKDNNQLGMSEEQVKRRDVVRAREKEIESEDFENNMGRSDDPGAKLAFISERRKKLQERIDTGSRINEQKANEGGDAAIAQAEAAQARGAFDGVAAGLMSDVGEGEDAADQISLAQAMRDEIAKFERTVQIDGKDVVVTGQDAVRAADEEAGIPGSTEQAILESLMQGRFKGSAGDPGDRRIPAQNFDRSGRRRDERPDDTENFGSSQAQMLDEARRAEEAANEMRRGSTSDVSRLTQLIADVGNDGIRGGSEGQVKFRAKNDEQRKAMEAVGAVMGEDGMFTISQQQLSQMQETLREMGDTAKDEEKNRAEERRLAMLQSQLVLEQKRRKISVDLAQELLNIDEVGMARAKAEYDAETAAFRKRKDLIDEEMRARLSAGDLTDDEKDAIYAAAEEEKRALMRGQQARDNEMRDLERRVDETRKVLAAEIEIAKLRTASAKAMIDYDFTTAGAANAKAIQQEDDETMRRRKKDLVENEHLNPAEADKIVAEEQADREKRRENERELYRRDSLEEITQNRLESSTDPADRKKAQTNEDLKRYRDMVKEGLDAGLDTPEAEKIARARSKAEIEKDAAEKNAGPTITADSLTAIGGGGGFSGTDPLLTAAERQAALLTEINSVLHVIAKSGGPNRKLNPETNLDAAYF